MSALTDSCFATETHMRPVTLPDGNVHELHFRELTSAEFRRFQLAEQSADPVVRSGSIALLISLSLVTPEGKPAITYDKAMTLKPKASNALTAAVLDVNGMGKDAEAKNV